VENSRDFGDIYFENSFAWFVAVLVLMSNQERGSHVGSGRLECIPQVGADAQNHFEMYAIPRRKVYRFIDRNFVNVREGHDKMSVSLERLTKTSECLPEMGQISTGSRANFD
jgi:hypothetical protein